MPSGIDLAIFRLITQSLIQLCQSVVILQAGNYIIEDLQAEYPKHLLLITGRSEINSYPQIQYKLYTPNLSLFSILGIVHEILFPWTWNY